MIDDTMYRAGSIIALASGYFEAYGITRGVIDWLLNDDYEEFSTDGTFESDYEEVKRRLERMAYGR